MTFQKYALGVDIIESVFDICDEEGTEEGLTLLEVKKTHCMDHLTATLGMLDESIARNFEAIDEDGDGLVSKQESFNVIDRRKGGGAGINPFSSLR